MNEEVQKESSDDNDEGWTDEELATLQKRVGYAAAAIMVGNFIMTYTLAICDRNKKDNPYLTYPNNCEPSSSMVKSIWGARYAAFCILFLDAALAIWGFTLQKRRTDRRLDPEFKNSRRPLVVCCIGSIGLLLLLSCVWVCKETSFYGHLFLAGGGFGCLAACATLQSWVETHLKKGSTNRKLVNTRTALCVLMNIVGPVFFGARFIASFLESKDLNYKFGREQRPMDIRNDDTGDALKKRNAGIYWLCIVFFVGEWVFILLANAALNFVQPMVYDVDPASEAEDKSKEIDASIV